MSGQIQRGSSSLEKGGKSARAYGMVRGSAWARESEPDGPCLVATQRRPARPSAGRAHDAAVRIETNKASHPHIIILVLGVRINLYAK
jgi:hypothetical protein